MRVISGSSGGTSLIPPKNDKIRPTSDKIKEAVFGALQFDIAGKDILDLFSGSGSLGIEALSRGADSCTFVDKSKESIKLTEANLEKTKLTSNAKVILSDCSIFLKSCKSSYDIIFIDPPYRLNLYSSVLNDINENGVLKKGGIIVLESEGQVENYEPYEAYKIKKYGITTIAFLKEKI